ncbi:hypothetical protein B0T11DRAFT_273243 [Plectosphaerella cucumerina]|uniref:Uncharacterized protein n=1 Tax=Plectosphaerella cucumerina TaxID=40658 RepID=A0A8K0TRU2_9PEZI|nr:hypothetical protein B0T11DRAFT_273243 [Plectosphaerella cucumerina]
MRLLAGRMMWLWTNARGEVPLGNRYLGNVGSSHLRLGGFFTCGEKAEGGAARRRNVSQGPAWLGMGAPQFDAMTDTRRAR